jgi:hypothetical protein
MVLTASFVLSPVSGLFCHRRLSGLILPKLDASVAAPGPHDFAVRFGVFVRREITPDAKSVHRIPRPTFRDDREAPLVWAQAGGTSATDLPDVSRAISDFRKWSRRE